MENILDDLFGLNIRGLKTILQSFINPRRLYMAALHPKWEDQFTPSARLWLSVVAMLMVMRFFWLGPDTIALASYYDFLESSKEAISWAGLTMDAVVEEFANTEFAILPFMSFFSLFLLAILARFGKDVTYAQKVRFMFTINTPAIIIGLFGAIATAPFLTQSREQTLLILALIVILGSLFDALTSVRMIYAHQSRNLIMAYLKGFGLAMAILAVNLIGSVIVKILTFKWIEFRYFWDYGLT